MDCHYQSHTVRLLLTPCDNNAHGNLLESLYIVGAAQLGWLAGFSPTPMSKHYPPQSLDYLRSSPVRGQLEPHDPKTTKGWRYIQTTDTLDELKASLVCFLSIPL